MTLRMGLVGAGPWAQVFHGPMIASGPETTLAAVWARRSEAAQTLAAAHGAAAVASFDQLLDSCEALAFAVPPDVQAELAPRAARAGRHLLLEKPLAFALEDAERLTDTVDDAGVQTVLMLRNRFSTNGQAFVASAQASSARGAQARFVSGSSLAGAPFATPWRIERGALFDLGPHVLDLMDAAMGPVVRVAGTGDPLRWVCLTTEHESGAMGQIALSITTPGSDGSLHCEVFTDDGTVVYDGSRSDSDQDVGAAITTALAVAVRTGEPHPIDVHRGLYLQGLLDQAQSSLSPD